MNPKSTSNQSSKPCTMLQYPSRNVRDVLSSRLSLVLSCLFLSCIKNHNVSGPHFFQDKTRQDKTRESLKTIEREPARQDKREPHNAHPKNLTQHMRNPKRQDKREPRNVHSKSLTTRERASQCKALNTAHTMQRPTTQHTQYYNNGKSHNEKPYNATHTTLQKTNPTTRRPTAHATPQYTSQKATKRSKEPYGTARQKSPTVRHVKRAQDVHHLLYV